jgi:MFS family permease
MEVLDTTIVNVALPHIAGTMSASYDEATWTLTLYLVANVIVLPISGFLGRWMGRKRYFLVCIVAFAICSFLCGTAINLGQLIVFRLLQGGFSAAACNRTSSRSFSTLSPCLARPRIFDFGGRDRRRPRAGTHARRLGHRQLLVALGVPAQCARRRAHFARRDPTG